MECALDSLVSLGQFLKTGRIADTDICEKTLSNMGELDNFRNCHSLMRIYSEIQQDAWNHVRSMAEQLAIQKLRKECCCSDFYESIFKPKNKWFLEQLVSAQNSLHRQLERFTYHDCLDEYFAVRLGSLDTMFDLLDKSC
jgi:hypothetical protein